MGTGRGIWSCGGNWRNICGLTGGVVCTPGQIVVGAGVEYLLGLLAQLLRGSAAAVENPGYDRPRTILENNGISCRCVDIDSGGLSPAGLEESGADLCYVTPSHHFPTGVTMPREEAIRFMEEKNEPYKVELIQELPEDAEISFYRQGDFVDLCAGPHLMSTKGIKAF